MFTSERPYYSLALFSSFIYRCTFSKRNKFALKRIIDYFRKKYPEYANNWLVSQIAVRAETVNIMAHLVGFNSEFILWNNKEITIENKSIFWAHLFEKGICFLQDVLDENGKFLTLDDLQVKYNVHLNFLQYFQLTAAIPSFLKKAAQEIAVTKRDLLTEQEIFYFSDNRPLSLTKLRCKDYYNLFQEGKTTELTAVKRWSSFFPYFATSWEQYNLKID